MTIYIDLDGTILDTAARYHALHVQLMRELGRLALAHPAYWTAKRSGMPEHLVGVECGLDALQSREYARRWTSRIEDMRLLGLDRPLPGALHALRRLQSRYRLVLVTLRQSQTHVHTQLRWWLLDTVFAAVLSVDPRGTAPDVKADLIRADRAFARDDAAIIGDSEKDICAGLALGIPCFAVETGIRTRELLAQWKPALIVPSLAEATDILLDTASPCIVPAGVHGVAVHL